MKNFLIDSKVNFIFPIFLLLSTLQSYSATGTLKCKKVVVDTVGALWMMRERVKSDNAYYLEAIERRSKTPGEEEEIEFLKSRIKIIPEEFSKSLWYEILMESTIPGKIIEIEREAEGLGCYTFMELLDAFHPTDEDKEAFVKDLSVVGKFDSLIEDRIGVFPANKRVKEEIILQDGKRLKGHFEVFDTLHVRSMWETVPPLDIPIGFEVSGQPVKISKCTSFWDGLDRLKDGLDIIIYNPAINDGIRFFYYFDGENWKESFPLNGDYLSYDDCITWMRSLKECPEILRGNWIEEDEGLPDSFLVIRYLHNIFGKPAHTVLKYKIRDGLKILTGNCYIEEPEYLAIFVKSNYEDIGRDVIVVEYIETTEEGRMTRRSYYLPVRDKSGKMAGPKVRGTELDYSVYLKKIAEGTLRYKDDVWLIKRIDSEW